jgi:2-iminoacetate synthase ThiH
LLTQQPKWRKKSRAALEMSLKKLAGYTEREAVRMMQNTIANDWQGLFPLKAGEDNAPRETAQSRAHDKVAALVREQGITIKALGISPENYK